MLILYPALHEAGHLAAALLTGTRIADAGLFPTAYVRVDAAGAAPERIMILSLSGVGFPLLFLPVPVFHRYCLYFIKLTIALMTAVGAVTSLVGLFFGYDSAYDDAALAVRFFPECRGIVTGVLLTVLSAASAYIVLTKPVTGTAAFFSDKVMRRGEAAQGPGSI